MGNIYSDSTTVTQHPLALVAVANTMKLSQNQLLELRSNCSRSSLGQKRSRLNISRMSFVKAMARSQISDGSKECDILHQLFTMWDEYGEERVDFRLFIASISPLACRKKPLYDVLAFALECMDLHHTNHISRRDLILLLNGINSTASYFGDSVLSEDQVEVVADSVFLSLVPSSNGVIPHKECTEMLASHPMVEQFVLGLGQYKYTAGQTTCKEDDGFSTSVYTEDKTNDGYSTSVYTETQDGFSTSVYTEQDVESGVIRVVRNVNGDILRTQVDPSSSADELHEI